MANHISPAAQLFCGMAELIDHDHISQTHYEAVTRAAEALAARATTEQLVAGPLWEADGAPAGRSLCLSCRPARQAATASKRTGYPGRPEAAARPSATPAGPGR
jgi:hypothetical protein